MYFKTDKEWEKKFVTLEETHADISVKDLSELIF